MDWTPTSAKDDGITGTTPLRHSQENTQPAPPQLTELYTESRERLTNEWSCPEWIRENQVRTTVLSRPCAPWPRGLSRRRTSPALGLGVCTIPEVVARSPLPSALLIARLYPASLRRSVSSPGPNRPLSCMEMPMTPIPPFAFPYVFALVRSACAAAGASCPFLMAEEQWRASASRTVVIANVRQSWVPPCVHVDPWFCEFFRPKHRDNHFPLRL